MFELGDVGKGAADPSGPGSWNPGSQFDHRAGRRERGSPHRWLPASHSARVAEWGNDPGQFAVSQDGKVVYIAGGLLDDTISVVEIDRGRNVATIPLGPRPEMNLVDRGERCSSMPGFHDGG